MNKNIQCLDDAQLDLVIAGASDARRVWTSFSRLHENNEVVAVRYDATNGCVRSGGDEGTWAP